MHRKKFLSVLGLGAVALACGDCVSGCSPKNPVAPAPTNVGLTLDLTSSANATLNNSGGYVYDGGIIIAHTPAGFAALSQTCTHQGGTVYYDVSSNSFICPVHHSRFADNGAVINGPATSPLATYKVTQSGNTLKITS
jgi:cytochrome b6-f complex iron-sulfur subunit